MTSNRGLVKYTLCMTCSAGSSGTESSRRSPNSPGSSFKDLQKWSLFTVRAEDIEVCKHPDGTPVELGRGGFCRVSSCQRVWPESSTVALKVLLLLGSRP